MTDSRLLLDGKAKIYAGRGGIAENQGPLARFRSSLDLAAAIMRVWGGWSGHSRKYRSATAANGRPLYLRCENSLAGVFQMLRNLPADGQFNVAVDAHVDDHRAVLNCKSFVDLAEIVGPIDPETLGAEADR
jgi:hypothetical protein